MSNRITYNRTTNNHLFFPFLGYLLSLCISPTVFAKSEFINVYLKLKPHNQVSTLIASFNLFLKQQHVVQHYKITPFLDTHPLHITLYLTHYPTPKIQELLQRVKKLAHKERPISFTTKDFVASDNAYVLLTVNNNPSLQQLSNTMVRRLKSLRDKNAAIPPWAAHDLHRQEQFVHYGSPNVFHLYNPHFSVMDPQQLTAAQQKTLASRLKTLIDEFRQQGTTKRTAHADAIAVGIADKQGQIIKELADFPL